MTEPVRPQKAAIAVADTTHDDETNGERSLHTLADLLDIMKALRDPQTGCPWDKEQNFASIAPYTIEEAYEVADAIARDDLFDLKDELGDLLLQVVYHAQMAHEQVAFDFHDVVDAIAAKMVRRHPHVFGDDETRRSVYRDGLWDRIKAEEKRNTKEARKVFYAALGRDDPSLALTQASSSVLGDVPIALPALTRAEKLQNNAAKVGFDWPDLLPVFDKLTEELDELREAVATKHADAVEDELGDVLFVLANIARHLKVDPEQALHRTNRKFIKRFSHIERELAAHGTALEDVSLDEMEALWQQAKNADG